MHSTDRLIVEKERKYSMSICESILSLNVRGLRDSTKRREIFRWLKNLHNGTNSIIFLQETHSIDKDIAKWEHEWGSKIIMSHGTSNSRGVAILFPNCLNFAIKDYSFDINSRIIFPLLSNAETVYCLINVYSPTQDQEKEQLDFLDNIQVIIDENLDKQIIMGGEFNLYL